MIKKELNIITQINFFLIGFKKKFIFLIFLIGINSLLEILSIGIFIPALNFYIKNTNYAFLSGFNFNQALFVFFGIIFSIFIIKFIFFIYLILFQNNFLKEINLNYNKKLLFILLNKPISFHIDKNSSENINLIKSVDAINLIFSIVILLVIDLFTSFLIIVFIFFYEPLVTIVILTLVFFIVSIYYIKTKNVFFELGKIRFKSSEKILKNLKEIFNGIKEIKIYRANNFFLNSFLKNQESLINSSNKEKLLISTPRVFFDLLMISLFGIIIIIFINYNYTPQNIIIKLGIFILVSLKILPIVNRILTNFQFIKSHRFSFDKVYKSISSASDDGDKSYYPDDYKINFNKEIEFSNINFKYPGSNQIIFKNLNLRIKKGGVIGIYGESGSGKSTFVDILCGFYNPTSGNIYIDHEAKKISSDNWLKNISYVPQKIFLSDNTISYNIAYGRINKNYDNKKINFLINNDELIKFISDLPNKAETVIGEDGLKISGGQRQRIGIARAIYKSSEIVILDEATSALDINSEERLLNFIFSYLRGKTIILISHRKETLSKCDKIYHLTNYNLIEKKKE